MAKSKGQYSKMYANMVDGKDEEIGEPPDDEGAEGEGTMEGIKGIHIEAGANGYSVQVHHASKEGEPQAQSLPHFFSAKHPAAHHIHAIVRHTKKK